MEWPTLVPEVRRLFAARGMRSLEEAPQPWANRLETFLRLWPDPQRSLGYLAENVVDHFAQGVGFLRLEEECALGAALDRRAWMQTFDRRRFAVGELDAHGAIVRVDRDHRSTSVLRGGRYS